MKINELPVGEKVDLEIEYVLNEIIKSKIYCKGKSKVEYRIYAPPNRTKDDAPLSIEEFKILELLVREGVIRIVAPEEGELEVAEVAVSKGLGKVITVVYLVTTKIFNQYCEAHAGKVAKIRAKLLEPDLRSHFDFLDARFILKLLGGFSATIDFHPKKGESTGPQLFMEALVAYLKLHGRREGGRLKATVPRIYIRRHVQTRDKKLAAGDRWLSSTRSNLLKKIPRDYKELIQLAEYDKELQGYPFSLPLPI
jgi:hypothetical protein